MRVVFNYTIALETLELGIISKSQSLPFFIPFAKFPSSRHHNECIFFQTTLNQYFNNVCGICLTSLTKSGEQELLAAANVSYSLQPHMQNYFRCTLIKESKLPRWGTKLHTQVSTAVLFLLGLGVTLPSLENSGEAQFVLI